MPSFYASRFVAKRNFMNFNYSIYSIYFCDLLCVNFKCKYRFLLVCSDITSQFFSSQCISSFATFSEVSSYVREVPPVGWTRDPVASIRWEVAQHEAWGNLPVTPGDLHRKQPKKKRLIGWNEEYGYGGCKQNWRRVTKKDTKGLASPTICTLPKEQQAIVSHDWSRELHRFQHKDATCDYWIIGSSELMLNKSCRQLNDFQLFQIRIGGIQIHPY